MNCQKLAGILDDGDTRGLSAAERRALDAHIAGCAECRAALVAHEAILAMEMPDMSPDLAASCRKLVAAQPIRGARRAGGRPVIGVGLLLAGAAAAAFVGSSLVDWTGESREVRADAALAPEPQAEVEGGIAAPPADVGAATAAATTAAADATGSDGFTVAVSFRQLADNPEAARATEGVYRVLVDELGRIPNLELLEIEAPEASPIGFASELAAREMEIVTLPQSGSVIEIDRAVEDVKFAVAPFAVATSADSTAADPAAIPIEFDVAHAEAGVVDVVLDQNIAGRRVELVTARNEVWHASASSEPLVYDVVLEATGLNQPGSNTWTFALNARSRSAGGISTSVGSEVGALFDASAFIERLIASLQAELFPVDEAVLADLTDRVLDRRLPLDEWLFELNSLKQMTARAGNTRLSDEVALAIVDMSLTITDPRQQSAFLRALDGVDNTVLVQPLGNALRNGASEGIRLEAAMLLAGFRQDPAARAALEAAAAADPSPAVRLNARWAALDESGQRDFIVSSLLDTRLTDAERIEPLLHDLGWARIEPVDLGMAIDVTVVNELSALLRRHEQDITRARVLARLQRESSPALTALFVERLNEDASEMVRITAAEALGSRLDEPGVRYALERAATGDAIGAVRQMATYSLEGTNDRRVFTAGVERR